MIKIYDRADTGKSSLKSFCKRNCKYLNTHTAFTLAEVLITLGIIGIVAAMTLPMLMQNYQKHVTETGLKAAYTILSEALNRSRVENGEFKDWLYNDENLSVSDNSWNFTNTYLAPYLKKVQLYRSTTLFDCKNITYKKLDGNVQECTAVVGFCNTCNSAQGLNMTQMHLPNGMIFVPLARRLLSLPPDPQYAPGVEVDVDINGYKGPNVWGKDIFRFFLNVDNGYAPSFKNYRAATRAISLNQCKNDNYIFGCGAVIMMDGWKIKKDYPW